LPRFLHSRSSSTASCNRLILQSTSASPPRSRLSCSKNSLTLLNQGSTKTLQQGDSLTRPVHGHASDNTLVVHAGEKIGNGMAGTDSIATPVVSGTTHWFKNSDDLIAFKEGRRQSFEYGRYGNPTVKVLEDKISALERAEVTLVTSSGMNAIVGTLLALVPPGGHVVTTTDCYSEARVFIRDRLGKMGIKSTFIDLEDMESLKHVLDYNSVTLFYADSPTNPLLKCVDIRLVAELCHRKRALVCIDSTLASPINQKPLTLGADIVLHSATKYMAGHHDVIAGCVSGSEVLISKVHAWHHDLGGAISPVKRGIHDHPEPQDTMALRVEAQNRTALLMARMLERHPLIERVHYPGLESSPWHHVAMSQMTGYGGVVSFEVKSDLQGTMRFIDALEFPFIATSLGGCESLVQQPAVMSFWGQSDQEKAKSGIKDNLVRFSFGIEKFEDLRDDILQALGKI
ncbi:hypothetical protein EJB05_18759, partial [Eragrostis curvula]